MGVVWYTDKVAEENHIEEEPSRSTGFGSTVSMAHRVDHKNMGDPLDKSHELPLQVATGMPVV